MPELKDRAAPYETSIFFSCPFDKEYQPIFHALIFATYDCGYRPYCALEIDDGGQVRVEKIVKMIRSCRLGVHNISRTQLDSEYQLPRFNMPFELGLFVGAARFGVPTQQTKMSLILDRERYRFQKFISDIAGQDIAVHKDDADNAIKALRTWLASIPTKAVLPGGAAIVRRYRAFRSAMPAILRKLELEPDELTFSDYVNMVQTWLVEQPRPRKRPEVTKRPNFPHKQTNRERRAGRIEAFLGFLWILFDLRWFVAVTENTSDRPKTPSLEERTGVRRPKTL